MASSARGAASESSVDDEMRETLRCTSLPSSSTFSGPCSGRPNRSKPNNVMLPLFLVRFFLTLLLPSCCPILECNDSTSASVSVSVNSAPCKRLSNSSRRVMPSSLFELTGRAEGKHGRQDAKTARAVSAQLNVAIVKEEVVAQASKPEIFE